MPAPEWFKSFSSLLPPFLSFVSLDVLGRGPLLFLIP